MLRPILLDVAVGGSAIFLATIGPSGSGVSATDEVTVAVTVSNFGFSAPSGQITVGDTVEGQFPGIYSHTTTDCGASCPPDIGYTPVWSSPVILPGGTYKVTFDEAGTYQYRCTIHPTLMTGVIVVNGLPTATPTPTSTPDPVGGIAELLDADIAAPLASSDPSGMSGGLIAALVVGLAAAVTVGGAGWYARRRLAN